MVSPAATGAVDSVEEPDATSASTIGRPARPDRPERRGLAPRSPGGTADQRIARAMHDERAVGVAIGLGARSLRPGSRAG
ncbi:MAG: hypothetical protein ACRDRK_18080 [Pseudonocardia sp.]